MSVEKALNKRSEGKCELCGSIDQLSPYIVAPKPGTAVEDCVYTCATCKGQIETQEELDVNHWRCLNDSMWNENPAVQVVAWRLLTKLRAEGWPQDLLDMLYLDEETLEWAKATSEEDKDDDAIKHIDVNGVELNAGDNVVLVKDLKVKGSSMVAKQGTLVQRISLDHDNAEYIEGRVNDQQIVILTKYVKKR